jgi:hypothetical protein
MQRARVFSFGLILIAVLAAILSTAQAQPKITPGDVYKSIKDREALVIISEGTIQCVRLI